VRAIHSEYCSSNTIHHKLCLEAQETAGMLSNFLLGIDHVPLVFD
jgi:hypothetical protein